MYPQLEEPPAGEPARMPVTQRVVPRKPLSRLRVMGLRLYLATHQSPTAQELADMDLNPESAVQAGITCEELVSRGISFEDLVSILGFSYEDFSRIHWTKEDLFALWDPFAMASAFDLPFAKLSRDLQVTVEDFSENNIAVSDLITLNANFENLVEMGLNTENFLALPYTFDDCKRLGMRIEHLRVLMPDSDAYRRLFAKQGWDFVSLNEECPLTRRDKRLMNQIFGDKFDRLKL